MQSLMSGFFIHPQRHARDLDIDQLKAELAVKSEALARLERELGFLRLEYGKLSDLGSSKGVAPSKPLSETFQTETVAVFI